MWNSMDELDAKILKTAEALIIITALRQFISRLEADRTELNKAETDATILFIQFLIGKYLPISKEPVKRDLKGRLFPTHTHKN